MTTSDFHSGMAQVPPPFDYHNQGPSPPHSAKFQDPTSLLREIQISMAKHNDQIKTQIRCITSDISNMKKEVARVSRLVSKLDYARERDTYGANRLHCEFRTFSAKTMSGLYYLQTDGHGNIPTDEFKDDQWNVYFHGEDDALSNFYMSPLVVDNIGFRSAEHRYQYCKAELHGRLHDIGADILRAPYGAAAKSAGKKIDVSPEWEKEKRKIMFEVLCLKAQQCPEFLDALLESGNRPLIHDLPDPVWGWGLDGCGGNLMGKILEDVRTHVIANPPVVQNVAAIPVQEMAGTYSKGHSADNAEVPTDNYQNNNTYIEAETPELQSTFMNTQSEEDWPALTRTISGSTAAQPVQAPTRPNTNSNPSEEHPRQVISSAEGLSLQVKITGDPESTGADHQTEGKPQDAPNTQPPRQRSGKTRGVQAMWKSNDQSRWPRPRPRSPNGTDEADNDTMESDPVEDRVMGQKRDSSRDNRSSSQPGSPYKGKGRGTYREDYYTEKRNYRGGYRKYDRQYEYDRQYSDYDHRPSHRTDHHHRSPPKRGEGRAITKEHERST